MKNKKIVMTAIAKEMEFQFKIATQPNNDEDFKQKAKDNIKDLYDAYFELRGHRGFVSGIAGVDGEVGNVDSIYKLTRE